MPGKEGFREVRRNTIKNRSGHDAGRPSATVAPIEGPTAPRACFFFSICFACFRAMSGISCAGCGRPRPSHLVCCTRGASPRIRLSMLRNSRKPESSCNWGAGSLFRVFRSWGGDCNPNARKPCTHVQFDDEFPEKSMLQDGSRES